MTPPDVGNFPLTGVAALPNVSVAFPGEHWSDYRASGDIVPGEAIVPTASAGKKYVRKATAGDAAAQLGIALRTVQHPDVNTGPGSLGPNEIVNQTIASGDWVHRYLSGAFHLTLIAPDDSYAPGDLIGWDADGARPAGKGGTGSWAKNADADIDSIFEVEEWRPYNADGDEGVLTVRSLRGQF